MPRARKRAARSANAPRKRASAAQFTCPECGRTFATAAALGSHRSRAHGVAGQSARARRSRTRASATNSSRAPARLRQARQTNQTATVNRDALLQSLFPDGIPASAHLLQAIEQWLESAEEIARMR